MNCKRKILETEENTRPNVAHTGTYIAIGAAGSDADSRAYGRLNGLAIRPATDQNRSD